MNIKPLVMLLLISPMSSFADCSNVLRANILKKLKVKQTYLFGNDAKSFVATKNLMLDLVIDWFGSKEFILENKRDVYDPQIKNAIKYGFAGYERAVVLKTIRDAINDPEFIKSWIKELYQDVIAEVYIEGTPEQISNFESNTSLSKEVILDVLLSRSKEGGFSATKESIEIIDEPLADFNFGALLRQKKLIQDKVFGDSDHGELIHIFHIDLMIQALKRKNINPARVIDFYQWMGESNEFIAKDHGIYFDSLVTVWRGLFDSNSRDFTRPENLNPIIRSHFNFDFE